MVLIEWRDEFRTGINSIDHEHEHLIDQINRIYALVDDRSERHLVIDSLGDIYGTISAHFALEERMMEKHGYPDYDAHKADHDRLLNDIGDITESYEDAIEVNGIEFKKILNDWFQIHFGTHDSKLHKLEKLISHEPVDETTIKSMIRKAKNRLLHRKNNVTG